MTSNKGAIKIMREGRYRVIKINCEKSSYQIPLVQAFSIL